MAPLIEEETKNNIEKKNPKASTIVTTILLVIISLITILSTFLSISALQAMKEPNTEAGQAVGDAFFLLLFLPFLFILAGISVIVAVINIIFNALNIKKSLDKKYVNWNLVLLFLNIMIILVSLFDVIGIFITGAN